MDSDSSDILLEILFILILVLLNAFFVASKISIVSLKKSKIKLLDNEDSKKTKLLMKLTEDPGRLLSTIQVGITFSGFFASAYAAVSILEPCSILLEKIKIPFSEKVTFILIMLILSYITLFLGEIISKRVTLINSEKIEIFLIKFIFIFSKITFPFVKFLMVSTNLILKIFGISLDSESETVTEEEIRRVIDIGEENGVINHNEKEMIDGIFKFDDTLAKAVMTPRKNVFALNINTPIQEIIQKVVEQQFSRIPVYEDDIDNIIGILYMKDLFIPLSENTLTSESIKKILRPAHFVLENKNIDTLFKELQSTNNYLAILIDEYGGFSGIVTMEDLVEEIFGNIFDEYDDILYEDIKKIDSNTYSLSGAVSIDYVNDKLDLELPKNEYETIGGFVINLIGTIPEDNKKKIVEYENVIFEVEKVNDKRIEALKIAIS